MMFEDYYISKMHLPFCEELGYFDFLVFDDCVTRLTSIEDDYLDVEDEEKIYDLLKTHDNIKFSNEFNGNVDTLPSNIKMLYFEGEFNKPIDFLPDGLTHLILGYGFNQKIDNLPKTLEHLHIAINFKQKVSELPEKLGTLILDETDNKLFTNIPKNCKVFEINYNNEPLWKDWSEEDRFFG